MDDLIKRIEAADGPDRELDWLIAEAFREVPEHSIQEVGFHYGWWRKSSEFSLRRATDSSGRTIESWQPKPRTASIDAALTLIPPCDELKIMRGKRCSSVVIYVDTKSFDAYGETPAIALCIAALKALDNTKP